MKEFIKDIKLIYYVIRYGEWEAKFYSKEEWPDKSKLGIFFTYYDGYHFALHIGSLCVSAFY